MNWERFVVLLTAKSEYVFDHTQFDWVSNNGEVGALNCVATVDWLK